MLECRLEFRPPFALLFLKLKIERRIFFCRDGPFFFQGLTLSFRCLSFALDSAEIGDCLTRLLLHLCRGVFNQLIRDAEPPRDFESGR